MKHHSKSSAPRIPVSPPILLSAAILFFAVACSKEPRESVVDNLEAAEAARKAGDYSEANERYEDVLEIANQNPEALVGLGNEAMRNNHSHEARDYFARAVAADPEHAEAHLGLAQALEEMGESAESVEHYRRSFELEPDLGKAHLGFARLMRGEDRELSIRHYRTGLELEDDGSGGGSGGGRDAEDFYDFGGVLAELGMSEEAAGAYENAALLEPEDPKILYRFGSVLRELDRDEEAVEPLRRAAEIEPDNVKFVYKYASVLKDVERWDDAIAGFRRVLEMDPADEKSLYKLASCLEKSGDLAAARDAYADAAEKIVDDKKLKSRAAAKAEELAGS